MSNDLFQNLLLSLAAILLTKKFENVKKPEIGTFFQRRQGVFLHLHNCVLQRFLKRYISFFVRHFETLFRYLCP